MKRETHIIDVKNKVLGRVATEVAKLLRGKHKANFSPNKDIGDFVVIKNISDVKITGKKMKTKKYYHHSGYLGSLREISLEKMFEKSPAEVFKKAVWGMLPKNKLRARQIKRLRFESNKSKQ